MLSLSNVHLSYGGEKVLRDITVTFSPGDFVLLLGSNGSGKSSLLRVATGLLTPDEGRVVLSQGALPHKSIGHFGHASFLYPSLSVEENLKFFASLYSCKLPAQEWELEPLLHKKVSALSRGQLARVSLCRTFLSQPSSLCLDEPTSFLDESQGEKLRERLRRYGEDRSGFVVLATHDISRLAPLATRAILLRDGSIISDSSNVAAVVETFREGAK
jgi:ABC-type multidrug transport system ATPase subunit